MAKTESNESTNRGGKTQSRQGLYALASTYSRAAITTLADLMQNAKQESVRMGAAKALLDKALPDLKTTEFTGEGGQDIVIRIIDEVMQTQDE